MLDLYVLRVCVGVCGCGFGCHEDSIKSIVVFNFCKILNFIFEVK